MNIYVAPPQVGKETNGGKFDPEVFQGAENSCAIHSQYHVLKDYGYTGTVDELIAEAEAKGWYDPATGTAPENVGKLLEEHGVPCNVYIDATAYNLYYELAQGKRIIIALDSGEIWGSDNILQDFMDNITGGGADHAVVVSGINTADPDNVKIILTDSGTGQAAVEYPLEQFMDAWKDGKCTMWVPQDPPSPDLNLGRLENFDWESGHIANFGNMSYDEFVELKINTKFIKVDIVINGGWSGILDFALDYMGSQNPLENVLEEPIPESAVANDFNGNFV